MSRFEARLLGPGDEPAWQAIWNRNALPLGLHWAWAGASARGTGSAVRVGVFPEGGGLLAGAAFVARRSHGFTEWHHPAPVPFAGLLHAPDALSESSLRDVLEAISRLARKHCSMAEIVFQPGFADVRGLMWDGWTALPHYNYTSRLENPGDLSTRAENSVRRQARKASESGVVCHSGPELLGALIALWRDTRARQRVPLHNHEDTFRLLVTMWGQGAGADGISVSVHLASSAGGRPLAGALIGHERNRAYYLLGASANEAEGTGAPSLLHMAITRSLVEADGPLLYDWVGANTPNIAQFKKKFRPGLECYHRARYETRLLRLLRLLRSG